MNILIYVITLLMLLVTITYAKLESFRALMGSQAGFVHYMGTIEKGAAEKGAEFWYNKIHFKRNKSETDKDNKNEKIPGSRLSFHLFVDTAARENAAEIYPPTRELAKRLMNTLYKETTFFQKMMQQQPNFLDSLINEIQLAASQLPPTQKIKQPAGIENLDLPSEELKNTLYKMLKGLPALSKNVELVPTSDDEADSVEGDESKAPPGYTSLIDHITMRATPKVRVYLASRPLLQAIYGDAYVVDIVIEKRNQLYKKVHADKDNQELKKASQEEFEQTCKHLGTAGDFHNILDFSVTNTNPKNYE